jgi:MYXO-CTERM domain-containing protein
MEFQMRNKLFISSMAGVAAAAAVAGSAMAGTMFVNALGASSGWYSDDTRNTSGTVLNGTVSSYQPYFQGALAPSTASDAAIAQQLYFTDSGSASGGGSGVMVVDGTSGNLGKTSVRYYGSGTGIGTLNSSFSSSFRWYMDPYSTVRTVAMNLSVLGTNGLYYSLSWLGNGAQASAWNTFSVDANTAAANDNGWRLYGNGAPGSTAGAAKSLNDWLTDGTYGSLLNGSTVLGQGFNAGSYMRNTRFGIDWLDSSLINGGDRVDFGVVPAPGAVALLGLAGLAGRRRRL